MLCMVQCKISNPSLVKVVATSCWNPEFKIGAEWVRDVQFWMQPEKKNRTFKKILLN